MKRLLVTGLMLFAMPPLAAAQPAETVEYYGQDAIGSIRIVWDANGNVVGRKDYAPFGRPLFPVPQMPKEGFGAQEKDDETEQGYFHARQYQHRTGRFSSVDPRFDGLFAPQRWNRYTYALNNPLVFQDFSGLVAEAPEGTGKCTWVEFATEDGLSGRLNCGTNAGGGGGSSILNDIAWLGGWLMDSLTGAVPVGGGEGDELYPSGGGYTPSTTAQTAATVIAVAAVIASPAAKSAAAKGAATKVEATVAKATTEAAAKAFHYTWAQRVDSILTFGLREGAYATPNGSLSALGAHIELALPGSFRNSMVEIDLAGLRAAGYQIPSMTRVVGRNGMPGGGYEMLFSYPIPPQFISIPGLGR